MEEFNLGTYANSNDTDNDGLDDFEELNTYGTGPRLLDTNKDGMNDNYEIDNGYILQMIAIVLL